MNQVLWYSFMNQVQDMQVQLQRRAESDDEVMVALNKKVAEWKVRIQGRSLFQRQQLFHCSYWIKFSVTEDQKMFITDVSI